MTSVNLSTHVLARAITFAVLFFGLGEYGQSLQNAPPAKFPARFESYLRSVVRASASEGNNLLAGAASTKFLDADPSKEVAVFGAIWIKASIPRYVEALKDIEHFENGGAFKITKRISSPPQLENFAELRLPDTDVRDLRSCRVGKCELKLSQFGIEKLRAGVDWRKPDAVASKMLYASHYFCALELRALVPDPSRGPGSWFVMVNRSRSDGLEGFLGRIFRGRVRGEVQKGVLASSLLRKRKLNRWDNSVRSRAKFT